MAGQMDDEEEWALEGEEAALLDAVRAKKKVRAHTRTHDIALTAHNESCCICLRRRHYGSTSTSQNQRKYNPPPPKKHITTRPDPTSDGAAGAPPEEVQELGHPAPQARARPGTGHQPGTTMLCV